jgi:formate dehydrogenase assembly factor FdhD
MISLLDNQFGIRMQFHWLASRQQMKEQCRELMLQPSVCGQCSDESMLRSTNQSVPVSHAKMKFDCKRIVHDRAIQCLVVTTLSIAIAEHVYCLLLHDVLSSHENSLRLPLKMFHETR